MKKIKRVDENFNIKDISGYEISIGGIENKYIIHKIEYTDGGILMSMIDKSINKVIFYCKFSKEEVEVRKNFVYDADQFFVANCMQQMIYDLKYEQCELLKHILYKTDDKFYLTDTVVNDMDEETKLNKKIYELTEEYKRKYKTIPDVRSIIRKEEK